MGRIAWPRSRALCLFTTNKGETVLVITGTGRSFTSVIAQFCTEMGHPTGGHWHNDSNCGCEAFSHLNNAIAEHVKQNGLVELEKFRPDIRAIAQPVLKDPRFVVKPGVLETWVAARTDLRFLICFRDIESSVKSAQATFHDPESKVNDFDAHVKDTRRKMAEFLLKVTEMDIPFAVLHMPKALTQYARIQQALTGFGGLLIQQDAGKRIWDSLYDRSKVHF